MATQFFIRVELHGVPRAHSESVYAALHDRMKEKGCLRQTTDTDGTRYNLPSAMYDYSTDVVRTARQIDDHVRPAVEAFGYRYDIIVIKANDLSYTLQPAAKNLSEMIAELLER